MDITEFLLRIGATSGVAFFFLVAVSCFRFKLRIVSLELGRIGLIAIAGSSAAVFVSHTLLEGVALFAKYAFLTAVVFGAVCTTVLFLIQIGKSDVERNTK